MSSGISAYTSSQASRFEDYLYQFAMQPTSGSKNGPLLLVHKIVNFQSQLLHSRLDPLRTFLNSSWFGDYVLAQSDKILEYWYFKPTNYKKQKFNQSVVERLQSSNFTRWITLVDIGIVEAFVAGDTTQSSLHAFWLDYVGGAVKRELERGRAPLETQERRTDWIHFSLMKAMVVKSSNAYRLLQGITPTFLETMFSDPTLWPDESNFMRIPLSNILASENHELAFFTSVDSTFSMAFGLPQQVEYDSTIHFKHCSTSHQWAHNTPADFQILLTEINTCRDKSPNARCWRSIEQQLIMWQSRTGEHTFAESWMTVAWYAVQESWRLALLAYLYIAVCDIPSNDPRIQNCVNQILQVAETLKPRGSFKLHASLFIQYLIAGICARTEAQRKKVRDKLLSPNETKLWLLRASDFVPVLDHLWHGVAVDGRSIRCNPYSITAMSGKLTALELVLTFLTMFGPVTKESLAAVYVLFEAVLAYDYAKGKFDKDTVKKVCGVADHLIAMVELYGMECDMKQLATPGGRRAILRVILGPVVEELGLEGLEQIREDAVNAMMLLTFKPLDEVQDKLAVWSKQAIKDGRYQTRVYAWTGLPIELPSEEDDASISTADEAMIATVTKPCPLGLEIIFTFLTMFGPVTEESIAATGVLFDAILGYSEATGKFDKATVKMVPGVSKELCALARLYGIRCEPRILDTPPGARAILREILGSIIEEHSPADLEEVRKDADETIANIMCGSLERVDMIVTAWAAAAREDGRYQARVFAWTGKPIDGYQQFHGTRLPIVTMDEAKLAYGASDSDKTEEFNNSDRDVEVSEISDEGSLCLEIATYNTVVQLVTVQALFAMDILPKQEASFTTMFPTPLDVCLGRSPMRSTALFGAPSGYVSGRMRSTVGSIQDDNRMDDTKELMDASDEEDYHRLVGFHFPDLASPVPTLDSSIGSTPNTDIGSPTFELWMATWHSTEMSSWKAVLQDMSEKEVREKERSAMFESHADAWESEQLSSWWAALQGNTVTEDLPEACTDILDDESGMAPAKNDSNSGTQLLRTIGRLLGFA
ncbi:hypothetical protein RHS03_00151, partial [Rhizoctonia solani]